MIPPPAGGGTPMILASGRLASLTRVAILGWPFASGGRQQVVG